MASYFALLGLLFVWAPLPVHIWNPSASAEFPKARAQRCLALTWPSHLATQTPTHVVLNGKVTPQSMGRTFYPAVAYHEGQVWSRLASWLERGDSLHIFLHHEDTMHFQLADTGALLGVAEPRWHYNLWEAITGSRRVPVKATPIACDRIGRPAV